MTDHGHDPAPGDGGDHDGENIDLTFGTAVLKGALVGLPLMVVFVSAAVWLVTGQSLETSIVAGLLPGVLFGVFGGGFIGMIRAMEH
ncbi:MAG: hypothetical protein OXS29_07370 [bacterium]|nr:hypothetical protein [bacterium]MDE0289952.1 hypothetical protein [bacterium]MDE0437896.1 hypothetical protein [bacterium]